MIPALVHHKIKNLHLYTKRLARLNFLGISRSMLKGSGLEFDQLRDYQSGDDVRALDWKSSARINKLLVKQFYEEKQRTIIIALDCSASVFYGSGDHLKYDVLARIAAIISYAGHLAKDEVGLILFTDRVETYIPARKGKWHITLLLEKIFSLAYKPRRTNISVALDYIAQLRKKNAMVFLISDFIDTDFEKKMGIVAQRCDVICVRMLDTVERNIPGVGFLSVQDIETGREGVLNTRSFRAQNTITDWIQRQEKALLNTRIGMVDITAECDVVDQLNRFFKIRKR